MRIAIISLSLGAALFAAGCGNAAGACVNTGNLMVDCPPKVVPGQQIDVFGKHLTGAKFSFFGADGVEHPVTMQQGDDASVTIVVPSNLPTGTIILKVDTPSDCFQCNNVTVAPM